MGGRSGARLEVAAAAISVDGKHGSGGVVAHLFRADQRLAPRREVTGQPVVALQFGRCYRHRALLVWGYRPIVGQIGRAVTRSFGGTRRGAWRAAPITHLVLSLPGGARVAPSFAYGGCTRGSDDDCRSAGAARFIEHIKRRRLGVEAVEVRLPEQLTGLDALIIPGGESTDRQAGDHLRAAGRCAARPRKPVWGTCAG